MFHCTGLYLECSVEEFFNFMSCNFGSFFYFPSNTMDNEISFLSPEIEGKNFITNGLVVLFSFFCYPGYCTFFHLQLLILKVWHRLLQFHDLVWLFPWVSHETGRIVPLYSREVSRSISRCPLHLLPCKVLLANTCLRVFLSFLLEKAQIYIFRSL